MLLNYGVGEDSWESLGQQGDPTSPSSRKSVLNIQWKDWCWSWSANTLATWYEELTYWKRPWCWERLKAGGEGDDRGWDGWMASPTRWTWVWVSSGSWRWTGKPGMLQSTGSQSWIWLRDWTELNWSNLHVDILLSSEELCPFIYPKYIYMFIYSIHISTIYNISFIFVSHFSDFIFLELNRNQEVNK